MILVTPADAAKIYGKTINHIYQLAHIHGWKRVRLKGRVYYFYEEIDASLNKDPGTC